MGDPLDPARGWSGAQLGTAHPPIVIGANDVWQCVAVRQNY